MKNERPTWCHVLFYFTSYVLNMFRILIYPSSGAFDSVVELPHRSPRSQSENKTTDVVIQQHSRKLLMIDILMSETCWAHNKWNKIASDIKLVFHSSTNTTMHGPINIRVTQVVFSPFMDPRSFINIITCFQYWFRSQYWHTYLAVLLKYPSQYAWEF